MQQVFCEVPNPVLPYLSLKHRELFSLSVQLWQQLDREEITVNVEQLMTVGLTQDKHQR